jgi:hypothetical protein
MDAGLAGTTALLAGRNSDSAGRRRSPAGRHCRAAGPLNPRPRRPTHQGSPFWRKASPAASSAPLPAIPAASYGVLDPPEKRPGGSAGHRSIPGRRPGDPAPSSARAVAEPVERGPPARSGTPNSSADVRSGARDISHGRISSDLGILIPPSRGVPTSSPRGSPPGMDDSAPPSRGAPPRGLAVQGLPQGDEHPAQPRSTGTRLTGRPVVLSPPCPPGHRPWSARSQRLPGAAERPDPDLSCGSSHCPSSNSVHSCHTPGGHTPVSTCHHVDTESQNSSGDPGRADRYRDRRHRKKRARSKQRNTMLAAGPIARGSGVRERPPTAPQPLLRACATTCRRHRSLDRGHRSGSLRCEQ